jgi:hypothetical protein
MVTQADLCGGENWTSKYDLNELESAEPLSKFQVAAPCRCEFSSSRGRQITFSSFATYH